MSSSYISPRQVESYLDILADHHDVHIKDIPDNSSLQEAYNIINNLALKNEDLYNMITRQHRPAELVPGTIGSFMFGRLQETYGDVPPECSPLHHYGIKLNDGYMTCEHQVWLQNDQTGQHRFTRIINPTNTGNAMVYTMTGFDRFTKDEIKNMSKHGVNNVQIFHTKRSKHHSTLKSTPLSDLPTSDKSSREQQLTRDKYETVNGKIGADFYQMVTENTNTVIFLLIAIILIVIVGMGIWNYFRPSKLR